jgi:hypothetical protein
VFYFDGVLGEEPELELALVYWLRARVLLKELRASRDLYPTFTDSSIMR